MKAFSGAIVVSVLVTSALAHMAMVSPPALRAPENIQYKSSTIDQNYSIPLHSDSS